MTKVYDLLMRKACYMSNLAEQAHCIGLLIQSGKLSGDEREVIETILHEKLSGLVEVSSNIQSSIAFDFAPPRKTTDISINSFPSRLRSAMKAAGLTQKELAERAGVSQSVISRLVTGKDKTGTRSGVLSHALGVNFDWLHYGTGEIYPANFSSDNREV